MRKICWSPGLCPGPRWGSLQRSPRPLAGGEGLRGGFAAPSPRTPLTILSLCLSCVYVHTCMKMHCYFLLNVKCGASQFYLGGGLQLSSAGTVDLTLLSKSYFLNVSCLNLGQPLRFVSLYTCMGDVLCSCHTLHTRHSTGTQ